MFHGGLLYLIWVTYMKENIDKVQPEISFGTIFSGLCDRIIYCGSLFLHHWISQISKRKSMIIILIRIQLTF